MPFVNYKFKCSVASDTITFNELVISIRDVKEAIKQKNKISENTELQLINERTNERYTDEKALISNGTILLATRLPSQFPSRAKDRNNLNRGNSNVVKIDLNAPPLAHVIDLTNYEASEDEKIQAIIYQSTVMYSSINYNNQVGPTPPGYRCHICNKEGHWIKDCPNKKCEKLKRTTGIPRSHLVEVDGPQVQGALMTENGSFALPLLDHQIFMDKQKKILNRKNSAMSNQQLSNILINESNQEEVTDGSFKESLNQIPILPSIISKEVTDLGIVDVKSQDCNEKPISIKSPIITIPKLVPGNKTILPSPVPVPILTSNPFNPMASFPPNFPFIDFSKPPPPIPSKFPSLKEQKRSTNIGDDLDDFLNDLRKRKEEDKKRRMHQNHKYGHRSRSRSRSRIPSKAFSTRSCMASPTDSTRSRNTRHHSKERRHEVDYLDRRPRHSSSKRNISHSRDRSNEHRHRDKNFHSRETVLKGNKRDGRWRHSSPYRGDSYDSKKRRR